MNVDFRNCLIASVCLLGFGTTAAAAGPPNLLVVVLDDVGVDQFSSYDEAGACSASDAPCVTDGDCAGAETCLRDYPLTPTIDQIAAEGLLFRNVYASASCRPARAAALTGRYGVRTGVLDQGGSNDLDSTERLIAAALKDPAIVPEIYETAAIGKWGLGGSPTPLERGFDYYAGSLGSTLAGDYFSWDRTVGNTTSICSPGSAACPFESYATTVQVNDALSWLVGRSSPWFLWLSFNAPHSPQQVPPHDLLTAATLDRLPVDGTGETVPEGTSCSGYERNCYMAALEAADKELGRLLAAVPDDTWVLVLGDNGTPSGITRPPFIANHSKGSLYEGGINVPLLIRTPDRISAGMQSQSLVHVVDLFATAIDLAGGTVPLDRRIDGLSLLPVVDDPSAIPRTAVYADHAVGRAARDSRYKLIRVDGVGDEFYDLLVDPFEQTDQIFAGLDPTEITAYVGLSDEMDGLGLDSGRVPDGRVVPGSGLSVAKTMGPDLSLSWSPSCDAGDGDYAIYSGTLGDFVSHESVACSTATLTTAVIPQEAGNRYYLVVPNNGDREGSHGTRSNGLPRLPTTPGCLPRSYAGCE